MCGIFGVLAREGSEVDLPQVRRTIDQLFQLSESRGKESSGISIKNSQDNSIAVFKSSIPASKLVKDQRFDRFFNQNLASNFDEGRVSAPFSAIAHTRLVTNGSSDSNENNQPVIADGAVGVHNGIICNIESLWESEERFSRDCAVDTEWLIKDVASGVDQKEPVNRIFSELYQKVEGTVSTALLFQGLDKAILSSNNGSLYFVRSSKGDVFLFSSERIILEDLIDKQSESIAFGDVEWAGTESVYVLDEHTLKCQKYALNGSPSNGMADLADQEVENPITDFSPQDHYDIPDINHFSQSHYLQLIEDNREAIGELRRCSKCLLPSTFPFIHYDQDGVCNYCHNYRKLEYRGMEELREAVAPFRKRSDGFECIVTLSGGRDSCYGLHVMKEELGLNPVSYTYDWGMVTDLARRNQARLCGKLGIEHILISADIITKRNNIRKNVLAWLKQPHLGTIPLFMAGDKQYFYWANYLQKRYKTQLVVLCENMLETTNFKSGFCGIKPNFDGEHTFSMSGFDKFKMLLFYGKEFLTNPSYLNSSLWDSFDAFRSYYFLPKDYLNLFDYVRWDEKTIEDTLIDGYNWELAPDTTTTWRIGDGTAAFYNFIYYTVAGFTEFDTFRSNQIREGVLGREEALSLVNQENQFRFESFKWYCDTIAIDMESTIKIINNIPKLYPRS